MTTDEFTRNSVVLDPADLDGIFDIVRYSLDPFSWEVFIGGG